MSELHDKLKTLGPVNWSDVPSDNLGPFLQSIFQDAELICNSVPGPDGGIDLSEAQPAKSEPDSASSAKDVVTSETRPPPPHPDYADLQKAWGKPQKINAKDNPLGISVYKMAGKDRNGAWFARRSVHEGISFTKFRKGMQREFAESLAVQGGPGEGNVRGIGGDRRLERKKVEGTGQLEVYQLSAQFPGPTTPREFITMLATSTDALSDKSIQDVKGEKRLPRHFMVVSKPCDHPDAPARDGYVRGFYESVELIRELPIHPPTGNEKSENDKAAKNEDPSREQELNPVEWIMITRSDPGGGIPRFMVERGTPSSICGDAVKFLDWACGKDEIPDPDADEELQEAAQAQHANGASTANGAASAPASRSSTTPSQANQGSQGVVSHLTNALEAGLDAYAPASVAAYAHDYLDDDDDSSSDSSASSFMSAIEGPPTSQETSQGGVVRESTDSVNVASSASTSSIKEVSEHDKELRKLEEKRRSVEMKLSKKLEAEDQKLAVVKQKDDADAVKAQEKHDKEVKKIEEKRQKELAKIDAKREKEKRKAEKKRQKHLDQNTMSQISRERDDFRSQVDALRRENTSLVQQYADLQAENASLIQKLNELGGIDAVRQVQKGH